MLVCRSDYDDATSNLYVFAGKAIKSLPPDVEVYNLKRKRFNRKNTESFVSKFSPGFIFFNGHGTPDKILGHNDEPVIIFNKNHQLLSSKIVYSLACNSAIILGKKSEAEAYIGYNGLFTVISDTSLSTAPGRDPFVKACLEPSNVLVKEIIKGKKVGEACKKSQEEFNNSIEFLQSSSAPLHAEHVLPWLSYNKISQVVHGNVNAVFK